MVIKTVMNHIIDNEVLLRLPKVDLHCHLDGSIRPETMWDILEAEKANPFKDLEELKANVSVPLDCSGLVEYLKCFDYVLAHLQKPEYIKRIAYEIGQDAAGENVRRVELRFSPILHTAKGSTAEEITEAAIEGARESSLDNNISIGVIVCCIREKPPELSTKVAEIAAAYKGSGVSGMDLAGDEKNYLSGIHHEAFRIAHENGVNITVHAGEVMGPETIKYAIDVLGARRIGHGLNLRKDPAIMEEVRKKEIPLEMCLTSNVHTKAIDSFENHPLKYYLDSGVRVTINTDNRLMSDTDMTTEFRRANRYLKLGLDDFRKIILNGVEAAFMTDNEKNKLRLSVEDEMKQILNHNDETRSPNDEN